MSKLFSTVMCVTVATFSLTVNNSTFQNQSSVNSRKSQCLRFGVSERKTRAHSKGASSNTVVHSISPIARSAHRLWLSGRTSPSLGHFQCKYIFFQLFIFIFDFHLLFDTFFSVFTRYRPVEAHFVCIIASGSLH